MTEEEIHPWETTQKCRIIQAAIRYVREYGSGTSTTSKTLWKAVLNLSPAERESFTGIPDPDRWVHMSERNIHMQKLIDDGITIEEAEEKIAMHEYGVQRARDEAWLFETKALEHERWAKRWREWIEEQS